MSYFIGVLSGVFFCFFLIADDYTQSYFDKGVKYAETQYLLRCYELEIDKKKCKKLITKE
jgi:ABC-type spermidine/putrescine transport system permease subunit II